VILVFSLENEESFKTVYQYYTKMNQYRNLADMPLILIGTQGLLVRSSLEFQFEILFQTQSAKVIHVLYTKIVREN